MSQPSQQAKHKPGQAQALTRVVRDEREEQVRPLQWRLIKRLYEYTRPHAAKRNVLLLIVIMRSVQVPMLAMLVARTITGPIKRGDYEGVLWYSLAFFALAIFTYCTLFFRMRLSLELGESVVQDLRRDLFNHLQNQAMRFYDRTKLGRLISRMTSDAESVRLGVQDVFFVTLVGLGGMVTAAIVMLWHDPPLFAVVLAAAPVLWWVNNYFAKRLARAYRSRQESFSRVTATLAETVSGIRVTQGFVREDVNAGLFRNLVADHSSHNVRAARLTSMYWPLLELNSQFFMSVLLVLGGYQVLYGWLELAHDPSQTFDAVVVFIVMMPQFFQPVAMLGRQYNMALSAMAGAERVFGLLDHAPEPMQDEDAKPIGQIEGHVTFDDLSFGYLPDKLVLRDLSFHAIPGQTIALVGHTGSGKSSIINLICKFYLPTSGQLLIDGQDVRKIATDSLRGQIGIVLQQNFLFTGTVMDNIRVGKADATDEQVIEAARALDCLDLFEAMPDGFYTDVGERGGNLSLGQRQLVCFTRAMLANPRILILDEATSSVDTMTEARIQQALSVLLQNRTSFVVAHRLSTIRHADVVLVLDHGRIIERGTHVQLLATGGVYANLYRQFIHASEA